MTEIPNPKRTRTAWTPADTDYIRANASSGAKAIAAALGRSEATIRNKAVQLGISLRLPTSKMGRRSKSETVSVDSI